MIMTQGHFIEDRTNIQARQANYPVQQMPMKSLFTSVKLRKLKNPGEHEKAYCNHTKIKFKKNLSQ